MTAAPDVLATAPASPARGTPRLAAGTVALLAALGVHVTWLIFVATATGQRIDQRAFDVAHLGKTRAWALAGPILDGIVVSAVVGILVAFAVCLVRRRQILTIRVAVFAIGATATTQILKYAVYDRPHFGDGSSTNSLPSGHTTAAATMAACLLIVVPRRWRPTVAGLGCVWASAAGVSTMIGGWHRPSDIVAALLVVTAWGAAVSLIGRHRAPDALDGGSQGAGTRAGVGSRIVVWAMIAGTVVGAAVAVVALVAVSRESGRPSHSADLTAYAGGIAGVVAMAALSFTVLLALSQASARSSVAASSR
jgi:membrane-associated phospholipid phosphatase